MPLSSVVVETLNIFQGSLITKLILILCLDHSWSLSSQCSDCLEEIYKPFVLQSFQDDAQPDEDTSPSNSHATVDCDWTLDAKMLMLGLVYLSDEIDE